MALIGALGGIFFSVSDKKINTIDDFKWETSATYATHKRHLNTALLEYTGREADTISFTMKLSVFLGTNPMDELAALLDAERKGRVMTLIINREAFGDCGWVITKTSKALKSFNRMGRVIEATVNVTLSEYADR